MTSGLGAAWLVVTLGGALAPACAASAGTAPEPVAAQMARRVIASADHGGLPFGIVDKKSAVLTIYGGDGRLAGSTPVLLGRTPGDRAVPGVGQRTQSGQLREGDHITTAGRFVTQPGRNLSGEAVVWIDYDSALAIHRLRPGSTQHDRALRLASADARARRVTAGCVVVPVAFYEAVLAPVLGRSRGVVYVLPEADEQDEPALAARDS